MAQMPVEERNQRSGGNTWKWLIALFVVGLLVWFVVALVDTGPEDDMTVLEDDQVEALDDRAYGEDPATEPGRMGPISDIAELENGTSPQQMDGADVQLTDVRVVRVVDERTLLVEEGDARGAMEQEPDAVSEDRAAGEMGTSRDQMDEDQMGRQQERMRDQQPGAQRPQADGMALVVLRDDGEGTSEVSEGQRIRMLRGTVRAADASTTQQGDLPSQAMEDGYFIEAEQLDVSRGS